MRSIKLSAVLLLTQFCIQISYAQSTGSQIKKLKEDWDIITHKKGKKEKQNNNADTLNSTAANSSTLVKKENSGQSNGLKPGDVSPNAKVLDADHFGPFNMGAAVIYKGNATALIDAKGNFIAEYGKYNLPIWNESVNGQPTFTNGIFTTGHGGFINSAGVIISDKGSYVEEVLQHTERDKWVVVVSGRDPNQTFTYIDTKGKKYVLNTRMESIIDGIGIVIPNNTDRNQKERYNNVQNLFVTSRDYDELSPFSEEMACVGKKDEFGEMKYGFIDKTGKEIIPPKYSIKPSDFHAGFAIVTPKDESEFAYAFINKKGEIVLKQTLDDLGKTGKFIYFANGLYMSGIHVMDSSLKITTAIEFLQHLGVFTNPESDKGISIDTRDFEDGKIRFKKSFKSKEIPFAEGFVDMKTKVMVDAVFDMYGNYSLYFDPVSKLAYAKMYLGKDKAGKSLFREGYINEQGIFVIVKAEDSKW